MTSRRSSPLSSTSFDEAPPRTPRGHTIAMEITLTDFTDFSLETCAAKVALVRGIKSRPGYDPAADFYKNVREVIVEVHGRPR
jgi:hypothetical protein